MCKWMLSTTIQTTHTKHTSKCTQGKISAIFLLNKTEKSQMNWFVWIIVKLIWFYFSFYFSQFRSYVYFDESPTTQVVCTNKTKDSHQFESFDFAAINSPFTSNVLSVLNGECMVPSYSHENGVSARKYAFNPLSEPFQPMRFTHSNTGLPDSFSSISSPQSSSSLTSSSECSVYSPAESACSADSDETNISPLKFVCILCPERYATLGELTAHINNKVHQPHTCPVCGSTYAHDYLLQRHLKLHRTLKSVRCRGCNKKFRSLNQLRKHFDVCQYKLHMLI